MSLSLALLNAEEAPEEILDLYPEIHEKLLDAATRTKAPLMTRMKDYYQDAEYDSAEFPALDREAEAIGGGAHDKDLAEWCHQLRALIQRAVETNRGLWALAD